MWFFPLDNFPSKEFLYNSFSRKISGNFTGNGSFNYYLSQSQNTFLRSNTTSLDHNKVLFDQTVMRESSHRIDGFICQIIIGGGIIFHKLENFKKSINIQSKINVLYFLVYSTLRAMELVILILGKSSQNHPRVCNAIIEIINSF